MKANKVNIILNWMPVKTAMATLTSKSFNWATYHNLRVLKTMVSMVPQTWHHSFNLIVHCQIINDIVWLQLKYSLKKWRKFYNFCQTQGQHLRFVSHLLLVSLFFFFFSSQLLLSTKSFMGILNVMKRGTDLFS